MLGWLKRRRRARLRAAPLAAHQQAIIERNVPIVCRLPPEDRRELGGHLQVFLAEKHLEGAGGLVMTEEIGLTIGAQACLLLLHRETDYFPRLTSIIVYPSSYVVPDATEVANGIWWEGDDHRLGHTQERLGALVLAWDEVLAGARDPGDGVNLVLHEFAHQLDFEDPDTDGTPALDSSRHYRAWAQVLGRELDRLRAASDAGEPTLLDPYGAESPAEFFAVATESFFETPRELRARHAALYAELSRYYRQDPASRW